MKIQAVRPDLGSRGKYLCLSVLCFMLSLLFIFYSCVDNFYSWLKPTHYLHSWCPLQRGHHTWIYSQCSSSITRIPFLVSHLFLMYFNIPFLPLGKKPSSRGKPWYQLMSCIILSIVVISFSTHSHVGALPETSQRLVWPSTHLSTTHTPIMIPTSIWTCTNYVGPSH